MVLINPRHGSGNGCGRRSRSGRATYWLTPGNRALHAKSQVDGFSAHVAGIVGFPALELLPFAQNSITQANLVSPRQAISRTAISR
jgi:hypothetical protein